MFFAQSWENAVCIVFKQGASTLGTFPQCSSHPAQRHSADLNWRSSLTLENLWAYVMKRITQRHCFILDLRFDMFSASLNLQIKEQPSDIVSERKETFAICLFFKFKLVQRGKGCPDIVMACETYFSLSDLLAWLCFVLTPFPAWSMDLTSCLILKSWRSSKNKYISYLIILNK